MIHATPLPGDIFLERRPEFIGQVIRGLQWLNGEGFVNYEHSGIVLEDGMMIEGQPGGAMISPLGIKAPDRLLFVSPAGLTQAQRQAVCDAARTFEGAPYSFIDYAAIGAHRLHLPVPGLRDFIQDTGHVICSQLCDAAYRQAGVELFSDKRWEGYVTPISFYNLLAV